MINIKVFEKVINCESFHGSTRWSDINWQEKIMFRKCKTKFKWSKELVFVIDVAAPRTWLWLQLYRNILLVFLPSMEIWCIIVLGRGNFQYTPFFKLEKYTNEIKVNWINDNPKNIVKCSVSKLNKLFRSFSK